jgi:hypothetical protein
MKSYLPTRLFPQRPLLAAAALLATFVAASAPAARATVLATPVDTAAALPVIANFSKVTVDGASSYVLKLTNTSSAPLKLTVTVAPSVTFHGSLKTTTLPARVVAAGDSWAVEDLHAQDKVSVAADGFAKLDLVVP